MKKLGWGLGTLVALGLVFALVSGRHHGPEHLASAPRQNVAAIAAHPGARAAVTEKAVGMAEETDSADVPSGFSPIAAAVAGTTTPVGSPIPARWVDGKHYTTLVPAQPTSAAPGKVEVVEVFWYMCPHCFQLDPMLENWRRQTKAPYVEFVRIPVIWPGNPSTEPLARLFYTMEALGKLEQLHSAVFREIHVNGNFLAAQDPADTERLQRTFLRANGVSDADFDKAYRSFSVESNLQRAQQLTQRYKVAGVPFLVVNGKYTTDVGMANSSEPDLIQLIGDLAAAERKH